MKLTQHRFFKPVVKFLAIFAIVFTALSAISFVPNTPFYDEPLQAEANSNCTNANATTPTWNPFPLNFNDPNPQPNGTCTDIPMISHWPIQANNPRVRNYNAGDTVTAHLYYNNGAQEGGANTRMNAPRARLELTQLTDTQYRLRSFLSGTAEGSGAAVTANSSQSQYGEDIIINIPNDTTLQPIRRQTSWFPQAAERLQLRQTDPTVELSLNIDNTITAENPLLRANGFQFYTPTLTNIATQEAPGLAAGFDDAGYFLISWNVVQDQAPVNNPPQLPGQEITIVRGNSGSFNVLNGTDPDGDVPLTYTPNNLPSFCTYDSNNNIISCDTNDQTPVRTEFTVTPTDSRGLDGTPGTFIVNVIEPELNITKVCVEVGTTTPCDQAGLQAGNDITYTITITNNATATANNSILTDDYDESLLENVRNINPTETSHDTSTGVLTWNLGSVGVGETITITYDATIQGDANEGAIVRNTAEVRADGVDPREASTEFPVGLQEPILSQSDKVCFKRGTSVNCDSANLTIGDQVTYFINVRNTGNGDALNVEVVDTYDRNRLNSITNIQPNGTQDTTAGTITWSLGTLGAGETRTVSFEATISSSVTNGEIIINTAEITADNLPPQTVEARFPVGIPSSIQELDRSGGAGFFLALIALLAIGAGVYYYKRTNKLAKGFIPSRSSEIKKDGKKITKKKTSK
jgi:uncharacterized repeat protein (TIGR01451 family)/fimbrial isopeptide formation D2 family protein